MNRYLLLLGRICMSALFLWAGSAKIANLPGTMEYMASKNMAFIPFFLLGALFFQIIGGFALLVGCKTRLAAWLLILFIIPAMTVFHDFWNIQGKDRLVKQIVFMNDLAILGGLLAFAALGAGRFSIGQR